MAEAQYAPRLKEQYLSQVRPALTEKFGYKNVLEHKDGSRKTPR